MNLIRAPEFEWSMQMPSALPFGDQLNMQGAHACSLSLRDNLIAAGEECELDGLC